MGLPNLQQNSAPNLNAGPLAGPAPMQPTTGGNLADYLFQKEKITAEQLQQIKFEAINTAKSIDSIVLERGLLTDEEIAKIKSEIFKVEYVDLSSVELRPDVIQRIPLEIAKKNLAVAFEDNGVTMSIAMSDPLDLQKVKFLGAVVGRQVKPFFASVSAITQALDTKYGAEVGQEVAQALEEVEDVVSIKSDAASDQLTSEISSAPVSRIVNMILEYAVKYKASDIHIEPKEGKLSIRLRINGVMSEKLSLPKKLIPPVVSRIKIMSDLKIDEHRIPQDGRFQIKVDNEYVDIRVSIVPSIYGEKVVMRLLKKGGKVLPLESTGLRGNAYKTFVDYIHKTQGIMLITGPTGSGKTQTLASSINIVNTPEVNIMTLEDPVEIRIEGVNQVQINADVGLTFARGLRSFLRQDPDIIMVGEIRDKETAELAIQASLTGHLVFSTLHTNSAAGALPRLVDMGIPAYLLASSINVVVGQRLARTLCQKCIQAYPASPEAISQIQSVLGSIQGYDIFKVAGAPDKVELFKSTGCPQCNNSGYDGRIGIFEVMPVSEKVGQLALSSASALEIERQARSEGMITMLQDGYMKALEGLTTIEEVLRVQN